MKARASARKTTASVFWDAQGILLIHHGCATSRDFSWSSSYHLLEEAEIVWWNVLLFYDNARPHTTGATMALLRKFTWQVFPHSAYSSNTAPSDYWLFLKLHSLFCWTAFSPRRRSESSGQQIYVWLFERLFLQESNVSFYSLIYC